MLETHTFSSLSWSLFLAGLLLVLSVLLTKTSGKLGVPGLILFLILGMLAGSEGPGGVAFANFHLAHEIGVLALVLILFSGGLDTEWKKVRPVLAPGLSLATVGVLVTASTISLASHQLLGLAWQQSLLLGAVVSSTDAAAIFGLLRSRGLKLRGNITGLLEFESGSNDPMAVFLTLGITGLILNSEAVWGSLIFEFLLQFIIGAGIGYAIGKGAQVLFNRLSLDFDGLYPVLSVGVALLSFGISELAWGNGYLSVYISGLTLGSRPFLQRLTIINFHDALAWLMQIIMFLCLGLLVYPSQLFSQIGPGIIVSVILILVARPLAVFLSLAPFKFSSAEKVLISWFGLRGAVPIILATIPVIFEVQGSQLIFNQVFFFVLLSVMIQGLAVAPLAKRLGLLLSQSEDIRERRLATQTLELIIPPHARIAGSRIVDLNLPEEVLIVLLTRGKESISPKGGTVLQSGDKLLISDQGLDVDEVKRLFI